MKPFVIFALPRSRTVWLSRFLTYGDWNCGHDELRHLRSMQDISAWFSQPCVGSVETAASPWWRLLPEGTRVATIRRSVADVTDSLKRAGFVHDRAALRAGLTRFDRKLDQIERRWPDVLSVQFDGLRHEQSCAALFEHCLQQPHDPAWWRGLSGVNLQVDLRHVARYYEAHRDQLQKLATVASHRTIAAMSRRPSEIEGVSFQQEPFETFLRDGVPLFAEHLIQVGEAPDAYLQKNLPLMRLLDGIGAMQITTARSNGRMFGYLMAIISPSLEAENVMSAMHTTFFASRDIPGIGIKLQRASLAALRERGVDEVFMRAGPRGSGPKMGPLYRRLGAESAGELFTLDLRGA